MASSSDAAVTAARAALAPLGADDGGRARRVPAPHPGTREIEDFISADPSVVAVAVIGVPDPTWGEAVKAVIVAAEGATPDINRLIRRVRDLKGAVHAPNSIDLIDELPLTAMGKPDKKQLRARYWKDQQRAVG